MHVCVSVQLCVCVCVGWGGGGGGARTKKSNCIIIYGISTFISPLFLLFAGNYYGYQAFQLRLL